MLSPPECFDQCREEDDDAPNAPHHLLGLPDARSGDGLVVVTESVMADLFQLQAQCTGSSGHGMPGVRTGSPTGVTQPDLPGFEPIVSEKRGECNNQQGSKPGRKGVHHIV